MLIQDFAIQDPNSAAGELPSFVDFGVDPQISSDVVKASVYNDHDYQQGVDATTKAIALDSKNPLLYVARARFYQNLGQVDKAHQDLDTARQFGPTGWTIPDAKHLF